MPLGEEERKLNDFRLSHVTPLCAASSEKNGFILRPARPAKYTGC